MDLTAVANEWYTRLRTSGRDTPMNASTAKVLGEALADPEGQAVLMAGMVAPDRRPEEMTAMAGSLRDEFSHLYMSRSFRPDRDALTAADRDLTALGAGFGWRALVSWFASDMYRMAICLIGAARSGEDTALVRCLTFAATAGLGAFGTEVEPVDLPALIS